MKLLIKYWWVLLLLAVVIILLLTRKKAAAGSTATTAKDNLKGLGDFFSGSPSSSAPASDSARINLWNSYLFKNQQAIDNLGKF